MQSCQVSISSIAGLASYPPAESYNVTYLTAWVLSLISIGLALFFEEKDAIINDYLE
jgi:hypothetical protein